MVEKQEQINKDQDSDTNVIIDNWEYLDDFLAKYLDHLNQNKKNQGNIFSELFNNLFTVEEQKKNIPTLNIIREKLWLYYYKEHFKHNSREQKITSLNKQAVKSTIKELGSQKLYSESH